MIRQNNYLLFLIDLHFHLYIYILFLDLQQTNY
nr:MAG TPA: hypothetical protein [Bacteriophage sp.]